MICGGTISGNCASGNTAHRHQTGKHGNDGDNDRDNRTSDEKIGHRLSLLRRSACRHGIHCGPWKSVLHSADNDALAEADAFGHDPVAVNLCANLDGPHFHFVVAVHHRYLKIALELRYSRLRYQQRVMAFFRYCANLSLLDRVRRMFPGSERRRQRALCGCWYRSAGRSTTLCRDGDRGGRRPARG